MDSKCCPPLMSDGRAFTDYRPRCMNDFTMCSYDKRQYMMKHADELMQAERKKVYEMNKCSPCVEPYNNGTMLKEKYVTKCDKNTCTTSINDVNGLGTGRNHLDGISSLHKQFLHLKEGDNQEKCINGYDDPLFYSYDREFETCSRSLHPSGMMPSCKK